MSEDIKELVKEARGWHAGHSDDSQRMVWLMNKLCDALEAMAEQRDRFVERFNEARLALQAAEAERDRLKAALETITEEHDAGRHDGLPEPCPAHEAAAIARGEATAPAVCEWTCVAEGAEYDIYDVGCDSESLSAWRRPEHCPSCGKPIKFTEAQR